MTTEMLEREKLIQTAMTWLGTPYVDHAEVKGHGCDCAGILKGSLVEAGLIEDFEVGFYHPQQWLHRGFEDRTYLDTVLSIAHEIDESAVQPGDIVLYKLVDSWTHGGLVVSWPDFIVHSITSNGACGAHGTLDGFLRRRKRRFFCLNRWRKSN